MRYTQRSIPLDLEGGVVPISKAASTLAMLLKRARDRRQPIIVTQKGYQTGELLDQEEQAEPALAAPAEPESVLPEPAPARRGGRRCKAQGEA